MIRVGLGDLTCGLRLLPAHSFHGWHCLKYRPVPTSQPRISHGQGQQRRGTTVLEKGVYFCGQMPSGLDRAVCSDEPVELPRSELERRRFRRSMVMCPSETAVTARAGRHAFATTIAATSTGPIPLSPELVTCLTSGRPPSQPSMPQQQRGPEHRTRRHWQPLSALEASSLEARLADIAWRLALLEAQLDDRARRRKETVAKILAVSAFVSPPLSPRTILE
jgi:hypothetical protein